MGVSGRTWNVETYDGAQGMPGTPALSRCHCEARVLVRPRQSRRPNFHETQKCSLLFPAAHQCTIALNSSDPVNNLHNPKQNYAPEELSFADFRPQLVSVQGVQGSDPRVEMGHHQRGNHKTQWYQSQEI